MSKREAAVFVDGDTSAGPGDPSRIAAGVLNRAFLDATYTSCPFLVNADRTHSGVSLEDHEEAVLFLTEVGGEWEESRTLWCEMAGVSEPALRERVVAVLADIAPKQE